MTTNIFTGVDALPRGSAPSTITEGCIVLEGGAFRALHEEGILDVLMQEGINFQCAIGVSAGALSGANYISGQIGRAARSNLTYRHDQRFVGPTALVRNAGIIGFDFVFDEMDKIEPMDKARFYDPKRRFVCVGSDVETGLATYFDRDTCGDIFQAIRASASMPYVSKPVEVDGRYYLDGGSSVKIPIEWALNQGYDRIVVVRTRDKVFRHDLSKDSNPKRAFRFYRKYPHFAQALADSYANYNKECDRIEQLEKDGRIFVFYPSEPVDVGHVERDMEKLGQLYYRGVDDAKAQLPGLRAYLGM